MFEQYNGVDIPDDKLEANVTTDPDITEDMTFELANDGVLRLVTAIKPRSDIPDPETWLDGLITEGGE